MKTCYCGVKQLKKSKSVIVNDPINGPTKFVTNIVHYFKLGDVGNCGSLIGFIAIDDQHYVSINLFITDTVGHYVITAQQPLIEHALSDLKVELVPTVSPEAIEEHGLEEITYEVTS